MNSFITLNRCVYSLGFFFKDIKAYYLQMQVILLLLFQFGCFLSTFLDSIPTKTFSVRLHVSDKGRYLFLFLVLYLRSKAMSFTIVNYELVRHKLYMLRKFPSSPNLLNVSVFDFVKCSFGISWVENMSFIFCTVIHWLVFITSHLWITFVVDCWRCITLLVCY